MHLEPLWGLFEETLFEPPSPPGLFNPYRDEAPDLDVPGAPARRRDNLRAYLASYTERPPLFLLAEAPGPWGCRFSGVPLVSEAQLADPAFPIHGRPTSRRETPHSEYSAGIYWRVLAAHFPRFFTWNSVPLHPFKPGAPLSIRTPTRREVKAYTDLLAGVLEVVAPRRILAVGRNAEYALRHVGAACTYVRHPSQGGARLFEEGVRSALRELGLADAS